jgi:hypothetical protein
MVPLKLSFITNINNPTGVSLTPGSTIHFGSLEFVANRFGHWSLSPLGWDSDAIFVGMIHSGSPSLCTTPEESSSEDGATSGTGRSSGPPAPEGAMW